jgi:hypothetical protein
MSFDNVQYNVDDIETLIKFRRTYFVLINFGQIFRVAYTHIDYLN